MQTSVVYSFKYRKHVSNYAKDLYIRIYFFSNGWPTQLSLTSFVNLGFHRTRVSDNSSRKKICWIQLFLISDDKIKAWLRWLPQRTKIVWEGSVSNTISGLAYQQNFCCHTWQNNIHWGSLIGIHWIFTRIW